MKKWCEDYMASDEFGFPYGTLVKPTTEELIFIRNEVIPDDSVEFTTGYIKPSSTFSYTPQDYGISSGHGIDPEESKFVKGSFGKAVCLLWREVGRFGLFLKHPSKQIFLVILTAAKSSYLEEPDASRNLL